MREEGRLYPPGASSSTKQGKQSSREGRGGIYIKVRGQEQVADVTEDMCVPIEPLLRKNRIGIHGHVQIQLTRHFGKDAVIVQVKSIELNQIYILVPGLYVCA